MYAQHESRSKEAHNFSRGSKSPMTDYLLWLDERERLRDYYNKFGFMSMTGSAMVRLPQA